MPAAQPVPPSTPLPLPSIASDGFEIVDIRPGPSASSTLTPAAPSLAQMQQLSDKKELIQETQHKRQQRRSEAAAGTRSEPSAVSMNSSPKQVISPGISVMPKMAAKSMGQMLPTAPAATMPTGIIGGGILAGRSAAEPKQSEATGAVNAGCLVGSNNTPSAIPEDRQPPPPHVTVPIVGRRSIVTPVLRLSALPGKAPAIPQGVPKPGKSR